MVNPEREPLSGVVEADETIIPFRTKNGPGRRARRPQRGRQDAGRRARSKSTAGKPRRARLKVIEGFGKQELQAFVLGAVAPQTQLVTDDWPSYHKPPRCPARRDHASARWRHTSRCPWIHRLFSNLKRWGLGVYHGLAENKPPAYTSTSSCFRFNPAPKHAMLPSIPCSAIGARTTPAPYRVLIRKAAIAPTFRATGSLVQKPSPVEFLSVFKRSFFR